MFERHFGLRENPFHSGHQLRFLYPSREHQEARAHLRYGIENREPFVLITGEVGTGKTTALYDALDEWGTQVTVALVTNSALSRDELLEEICLRFGVAVQQGMSKPQSLALLERHLDAVRARGAHAVLILDEAQNLEPDLLEEIRLLSNLEAHGEKLVQIFLVGQPELEGKLSRPELRQLRQRISVHYRLNPLSPEETAAYIHHRVSVAGGNAWAIFPAETCRDVYRVTHGIPREINTLASLALIASYTDGDSAVRPSHVQASARETEFRSVMGETLAYAPDASPAPAPAASAPVREAAPPQREFEAPQRESAAPPPRESEQPRGMPPARETAPPQLDVAPAAAAAPPVPAVPAWTPPELPGEPANEPPVERVDPNARDAWSVAARGLLEARRRQGEAAAASGAARALRREESEEAPERDEETDEQERAARTRATAAAAYAAAETALPRFPSPAELQERAFEARPDRVDLSSLPQRLREKIESDIAREESGSHRALPWVLAAVTLAAATTSLVLLQRYQAIDVPLLRGIAGTPAHTAHAVTPPPVSHRVAATTPTPAPPSDSARTTRPADGSAERTARTPGVAAVPAPVPATKPATGSPATHAALVPPASQLAKPSPLAATNSTVKNVPAPPSPGAQAGHVVPATNAAATQTKPAVRPVAAPVDTTLYGIAVGAYLEQDRANQERDRLANALKLPGHVMPFEDGSITRYRVVMGSWASNASAQRAADKLLAKGSIQEATILVVGHARAR